MKYFGLLYAAIGIFLGCMTIRNAKKVSLHMRFKDVVVIDEEKYFKMQKLYGMVSSIIVFTCGLIFYIGFDKFGISLIVAPIVSSVIYNLVNSILIREALKQKFIRTE